MHSPEATGVFFEDLAEFSKGDFIMNPDGFTLTEEASKYFACSTGNPQLLHLDEEFAETTRFGAPIGNGIQTFGIIVGRSVEGLTNGSLVANLGYDSVIFPPVSTHIGDTFWTVTQVLKARTSKSYPGEGIVRLRHTGFNQNNQMVFTCDRTILIECSPDEAFRPRRSLLYVPGDNLHMIKKARTLGADSVVLDLEDGIAPSKKNGARKRVARALKTYDFGRSERLVRINSLDSGLAEQDLASILPANPDGIILPKAASAEQVKKINTIVAHYEATKGMQRKKIRLLIMLENAEGITNIAEITKAGDHVDTLVFGAEDFIADARGKRTKEGNEVLWARSQVVAHAAAHGLQAIDMIFADLKDTDGLRAQALAGRQLGFSGMQLIHPDQIEQAHKAFSPTTEEISYARRLLAAHEEHQNKGVGVFSFEGRMVDLPMVKQAQNILALSTQH